MSLTCYSCGKVCSALRTPAWNDLARKVFIGPDCYRHAEKGGHEGFYHEKTDTHVFASETLAREWVKRLGEEGEEELDSEG